MFEITLRGHIASRGMAEGEALVYEKPFEFRDVDPQTGLIDVPGHELFGQEVKNKIMVFPCGCGPSTEEWAPYVLKKSGVAPKGILNISAYSCSTIGAIIADIPMLYGFDRNFLEIIASGDYLKLDGNVGFVQVIKRVA